MSKYCPAKNSDLRIVNYISYLARHAIVLVRRQDAAQCRASTEPLVRLRNDHIEHCQQDQETRSRHCEVRICLARKLRATRLRETSKLAMASAMLFVFCSRQALANDDIVRDLEAPQKRGACRPAAGAWPSPATLGAWHSILARLARLGAATGQSKPKGSAAGRSAHGRLRQ